MADLTTATMTTTDNTTARALGLTPQTTTSANPTNEELDIEIVDELYPWAADDNERRRAFIFEYFNWNPDIHVDAQLQQLASIYRWLRGQ